MSDTFTVRDAIRQDVRSISTLVCDPTTKCIGNIRNKYDMNEAFKVYQTHRLVVELGGSIVAYAEFRNYPAIGPLPSDSWLEWLLDKYCITVPLSWVNTIFLNFCIYQKKHPNALLEAVRLVFYRDNRLWYLITVRPPMISFDIHYAEYFDDLAMYAKIYYPRDFSMASNPNTQAIYLTDRYSVLPVISYRKALAEDNDDIVEIHSRELPEMRAELGDFYIAEELLRTDSDAKDNVIIVLDLEEANPDNNTAGFMWLNANVDIRFYVTNFEMEIFGNLVKHSPHQPFACETIPVMSLERKPEAHIFTASAMDEISSSILLGSVQCNDSTDSMVSTIRTHLTSVSGNLLNSNDKFNTSENTFFKFLYIVENFSNITHYFNKQRKVVDLYYNTADRNSTEDWTQSASNVFELKFISVSDHFPLPRLFSSLNAMYSAFPDRDYCIMRMPKRVHTLRSHVEVLKYFMPVAQRPSDAAILDDLYITHRSTIFGEISLHRLQSGDTDTVLNMLKDGTESGSSNDTVHSFARNSKLKDNDHMENELHLINELIKDVLSNAVSKYDFFTIRCGNSSKPANQNTIIGYVVLRKYVHRHKLSFHYHLPKNDQHLDNERAEIISLRLHPIFHNSADLLMRNLAAKTNYFDFYYIYGHNKFHLSNDLKTMMMHVEPIQRKKIIYKPKEEPHCDCECSRISILMPSLNYVEDALVVFRHKLSPTRWFGKSNRMVIIGFTALAKAFLRQLVFQWNSKDHANSETFNCLTRLQVTVIAAPGQVEADYDFMFNCPYCAEWLLCYLHQRNSCCYVRDVTHRMDLRLWIHFVAGNVDYINREKKYVKFNETCELYYDTLMLMNYVDFNLNLPVSLAVNHKQLPANFVEINSRLDKFLLFFKLRVLQEEDRRKYVILIYGYDLRMFECIAFLLNHGVQSHHIVLVMPRIKLGTDEERKLINPYRDQNLGYVLEDMLDDLKVKTYRNLNFSHWITHYSANFIIEVVFKNPKTEEEFYMDCDLFISFQVGYMDSHTEKWLTNSGIEMYEKRILVTENFQTNDEDIYAAGSFVEINDNVNYQYQYTSEMELSQKLMEILQLRTYDTPFEYKYARCTFFKAQMPLKFFLTKVTMPRRYLSTHITGMDKCSMSTYWGDTFCRIGLTSKMFVDEIVVVTKASNSLDFLEFFCGKHETLLNNMKARYSAGSIVCFLEFLQQPWTELLMHPDFEDQQAKHYKLMMPMIKNIHDDSQNFQDLNRQLLEQSLLEFLRTRREDFHNEIALPEDYDTSKRSNSPYM